MGAGFAGNYVRLTDSLTRADLHNSTGLQIASNQTVFDLRDLAAGTYYLRAFSESMPTSFGIEIAAPEIGQTLQTIQFPDRDVVRAGDGDDRLTGNYGLDRMLGQSGADTFVAEQIEVLDFGIGDQVLPTAPGELTTATVIPQIDPDRNFQ